ncbi:MAG: leucine--tRNA ligase, partial [Actinomycetota bacterium]
GRSEGARVRFASSAGEVEVFTTRPDTLFGATFMVLSPEHPLVERLISDDRRAAVRDYQERARSQKDADRQDDTRDKTGEFIGAYATNPVNGHQIPIWIADYVLMGYGTGAIMAVPSGDQRDFEFARTFDLPIIATQRPPDSWFADRGIEPTLDCSAWPEAFVGEGDYVNSRNATLSRDGLGGMASAITYKLRDWLVSRQRYWGEPFPLVYDEHDMPAAVPFAALPVRLPELDDFKPQALDPHDDVTEPIPPLARVQEWVNVDLDLGDGTKRYRREVNVMPQWAGSCWYELRYLDPTNDQAFVDKDVERYWMGPKHEGHTGGVDLYVGGVEHAVLHLLYSRFWHKVLFDLGHVSSVEPFHRLFNQGYIQAYAYRDSRGQTVPANEVDERDGTYWFGAERVAREYGKMGKSLKNVVTPDEMYDEFGADTFRLYEMSTGPLEASRPWNTRDVIGMQRFLQRVWRNLVDEDTGALRVSNDSAPVALLRETHKTIAGVAADMQNLRFNTAIAKLIELNNVLTAHVNEHGSTPREVALPLAQMLSPLCPHVGEELWERFGNDGTVTYVDFPVAAPALLVEDTIEIPVQVNGKLRSKVTVDSGAPDETIKQLALADPKIVAIIGDAQPKKVIVVPQTLINIVL